MAKPIQAKNFLANNFYTKPETARQTMTTAQFQATMLYTEGQFLANGSVWIIKSERLAPGVFLITAQAWSEPPANQMRREWQQASEAQTTLSTILGAEPDWTSIIAAANAFVDGKS